ncbi:hypothetical protein NGRA_2783 [Nosema granulosis]|uniref:Mediator of RNA polymerase II transcription subunit 18 n=1 Tax=Nosema granulosis TaxID=83296 RepID=A0A9P6KXV4_9MICR|nr:hypothetical protein NGRA_2783 [Nosema granulosis]
MIECAMYSYISSLKQIHSLRSIFREESMDFDEIVYTKDASLVVIRSNEKKTTVTKKSKADKNKNRKQTVTIVETTETSSLEGLINILELSGYSCTNRTKIQEILFTGQNFYVSISKEVNNSKIIENDCEKYWLVKVFSLSDSLQNSEQIFSSNIEKIEDLVDLKNTEFNAFDQ